MAEDRILKESLDIEELAKIAGGVTVGGEVTISDEEIEKYKSMLATYKKLNWSKEKVIAAVTPFVSADQLALIQTYLDLYWDMI